MSGSVPFFLGGLSLKMTSRGGGGGFTVFFCVPKFSFPFFTSIFLKRVAQLVTYLEDHPRTCKWLITMVIVVVP